MRCSPSIVPPELGPANAGPLCVLASPIGSIPEDTGSHSNQMVGAGRGLWGMFNETARVIRRILSPVESALFALKVSGTVVPRHFGFLIRSCLTRSPRRRDLAASVECRG